MLTFDLIFSQTPCQQEKKILMEHKIRNGGKATKNVCILFYHL